MDALLLKQLVALVHVDIDAWHAYGHAIRHVELDLVKHQLQKFQEDHERHVKEWCDAISKFGGEPPPFSRDLRGFVMEGVTAIRSVTGTEGALKAIRLNEVHTNGRYDEQEWIHMPPELRELLHKNQQDEHRHLQYVEQAIEVKVWEDVPSTAARIIVPLQFRPVS